MSTVGWTIGGVLLAAIAAAAGIVWIAIKKLRGL